MWPFNRKKNLKHRVQIYRRYYTEKKPFYKLFKSTLGLSSDEVQLAMARISEGHLKVFVSEKELIALLKIVEKYPEMLVVAERTYDSIRPGETNTDRCLR